MIQTSEKNWSNLYARKQYIHSEKLAGYYNNNYVIKSEGKKYLLRIPISNAESMDLRVILESIVLKFLENEFFPAPRLIYSDPKEKYFIHKYIEGKLFHDLYPTDTSFPDWVSINIANQMKNLHQLSPKSFEPYCKKIAKSPDSSGFFQYLMMLVEDIYGKSKKSYATHFKKLKFPEDPFTIVRINSLKLKPRKFTLCHCDIHRKNLIITENNKRDLVILDWELTLVADPFYDIATHFHKMRYNPSQELLFLEHYLSQNSETTFFKDSWDQIQIYLQSERVKSAIVDIVRMSERFKAESSEEKRRILAEHYQNDGFIFMMTDKNNKTIGSIYLELKPKHISKGKQIPIFGWLNADSKEIAEQLLNHVEKFVKIKGYNEIRGPLNMPKMFGWGAQVEYFECPMYWETPHNHSEIPKWIEECGYKPDTEYITLELTELLEVENPYPELEIVSYPVKELFANNEMMGKLSKLIKRNFSGFLPDITTDSGKFEEMGKMLMETGHGQDFYILAIDRETKDLVGFIVEVPNIFDTWAGNPLKNVVVDTVIVDEKYRNTYFFFFLFNEIYKKLTPKGIDGVVSGLIWSKNIPAMKTFIKIGKQVQKTVVFQKSL